MMSYLVTRTLKGWRWVAMGGDVLEGIATQWIATQRPKKWEK